MHFAHQAIAMVTATTSLSELTRQRIWWDRGLIRTYIGKHLGILKFWIFNWRNFIEIAQELLFSVIFTYAFAVFGLYLLFVEPRFFLIIYASSAVIFMLATAFALMVSLMYSERRKEEFRYLWCIPLMPVYKELFRWIRLYAMSTEFFKKSPSEPLAANHNWENSRKW